jgi:polar amino acid transport system substrate-binding protein
MTSAAEALAPTGTLRAVINTGNAVLARRSADGTVDGVSVDLARELGRRLGVPLRLAVVDGAAKSVEAVAGGRADVGFFAIDPERGAAVAFTAPYVLIEGCYVVRDDSPIRSNGEVDVPGRRVAVAGGSAYDLYLGRALKAASIVRAPTSQAVVDTFVAERLEVAAGVRQQLEADLRRVPGLRMVEPAFMTIRQAMGTPKAHGEAAAAALRAFVEDAKRGGFVADALRRHGIEGARVAPPEG